MLAWSNIGGTRKGVLEAPAGGRLTTVECLDFLLDIPASARLFAYAFQYDLTKILTDVDDACLFNLFRPELRQRKPKILPDGRSIPVPPWAVKWNGYTLNYLGSRFSVAKDGRETVIWDVFKFFQAKFVNACEDWKVGEEATLNRMRRMKEKRAEFDQLNRDEILAYCYDECAYMAALAEKLDVAHEKAGLNLRNYHGAGSTASCILKALSINKAKRTSDIPEMVLPISCAFFGGRFENSVIGEVAGPIWGYDISSAYPYQTTFLPCLECGKWEHITNRRDLSGRTALVRYKLGAAPPNSVWGPFPFRTKEGSIAFPATSGGGWVWLAEYLQGERLFPHVQFCEAWTYNVDCKHQPFAEIPKYYLYRLKIGKEGPGIVVKLGVNAVYGKLAQSLGLNPPFQSWIWAGMITSGCRAQILELMGLHRNWANVLMIATDGIYSREQITCPTPLDTGTMTEHGKPLGGWERKLVPQGVFAARPGIYFPLNPLESDLKAFRARGVGRNVMAQSWRLMVDAWKAGESGVALPDVSRFHGAKSAIGRTKHPDIPGSYNYTRHPMLDKAGNPIVDSTGKPRARYGQWETRKVELSFNPLPKREFARLDNTLQIRSFGADSTSAPYAKSTKSVEAQLMMRALLEALEQPDGGDFADYEDDPAYA